MKRKLSLILVLLITITSVILQIPVISTASASGAPGTPSLSQDNYDGNGSYIITMNMWWGNNGTTWNLYENGTLINTASLADNSPNQQTVTKEFSGKTNGTYTYQCDLINGFGMTTSSTICVSVTSGSTSTNTPTTAPSTTPTNTPTTVPTTTPTTVPTTTPTTVPTHTPTTVPTHTPTPTDGSSVVAWSSNSVSYKINDIVSYNGKNYKCTYSHTSNVAWTPEAAFTLWALYSVENTPTSTSTNTPTSTPTSVTTSTTSPIITPVPSIPVQKVLVLSYDPILENRNSKRLHEYGGWNDPSTLISQYAADLLEASGGNANYQVAEYVTVDDYVPYTDGFKYTDATYADTLDAAKAASPYWWNYSGWHTTSQLIGDYNAIINSNDIINKVNSGEIDEVWVITMPMMGLNESRMVGRQAYAINSSPIYRSDVRNFAVMAFNYERGNGEMLENFGHRTEWAMTRYYGRWVNNAYDSSNNISMDYSQLNGWEKFTMDELLKPLYGTGAVSCAGTIHWSPNVQNRTTDEYVHSLTNTVSSNYLDFKANYPNLTNTAVSVNNTTWGGGNLRSHHKWWLSCIPTNSGVDSSGILNNWWHYIVDLKNFPSPYNNPDIDLTPTPITTSITTYTAGQTIDFDSGITNSGNTGTNSFNIKWYINGELYGYGGHCGIPADTTLMTDNSAASFRPQTAGSYTITFEVDADNGIAESDETNNSTSITINVY